MGMLKFTVHTGNLEEILSKKIHKAANEAELVVADEVLRTTDPFVPARTLSQSQRAQAMTALDEHKPMHERAKKRDGTGAKG